MSDWYRIELTYTSNAIEGNTLTLAETEVVIRRGLTVHGKPLKDHLEARNHLIAFQFLRQLVAAQTALSEKTLLQLHALILRGIEDEWAGRYRTVSVRISGSHHIPPNPLKVPDLMTALFTWYGSKPEGHPVEIAADLHLRLAQVHPFIDGNKRTAYVALEFFLALNGVKFPVGDAEAVVMMVGQRITRLALQKMLPS